MGPRLIRAISNSSEPPVGARYARPHGGLLRKFHNSITQGTRLNGVQSLSIPAEMQTPVLAGIRIRPACTSRATWRPLASARNGQSVGGIGDRIAWPS